MKKRLFAIVLVLLLVLTALVACKPDDGKQTEELLKDQTINVYSWWDPTNGGLEALKEGFETKYASYNVKLNFVKVSGSYYTSLLTKLAAARLAGGSAEKIDVMMLAFEQLPFFAQNGQLQSLEGVVDKTYLDSLYPSVKESLYFNDTLYALPRDVTSWCTYINKDVFTANGITVPSANWTMEQFITLCGQFQQAGTYGFATNDYTDVLSPWLYLYGGKYFDGAANISTLSAEAKAGILALYHLMENDGAMTIAQARSNGKAQDAFGRGEVAMFFGGLSDSIAVENYTTNYTVLPLPAGVNGHQSHTFTNCWTVPTISSQSAWGKEVVKYFSSAEGQKIAAENDMGLPAIEGVDLATWVAAKPIRQSFIDALGYEKTVPYATHVNGSGWGTNARVLLRDEIFNVEGMTDAELIAKLAELDNSLTYYLMGGA